MLKHIHLSLLCPTVLLWRYVKWFYILSDHILLFLCLPTKATIPLSRGYKLLPQQTSSHKSMTNYFSLSRRTVATNPQLAKQWMVMSQWSMWAFKFLSLSTSNWRCAYSTNYFLGFFSPVYLCKQSLGPYVIALIIEQLWPTWTIPQN